MHVTVIGAGSWGSALASLLRSKDHEVVLWDIDRETVTAIEDTGNNERYLPGLPLSPGLRATTDLAEAVAGADLIVLAVPSQVMRDVAERLSPLLDTTADDSILCSVTKGIEVETLMTMHQVLEDVFPAEVHPRLIYLSGPSFAVEVAAGLPTAVTIAGRDLSYARRAQIAFATKFFRPYVTEDVVGVEIGGCAKNVVAIAVGLANGMGFERNADAGLITRGLSEITRLGVALGADPLTFGGLSGVGDLVLTCTSEKSRNYRVGYGLGRGEDLESIQERLGQVAEGVVNAKAVHLLAVSVGVEMSLCNAVYRLLYEGLTPEQAVDELAARDLKHELPGREVPT
ncbi:MAG: NAD(P)H-dependent glycerol-3-phosphate dehydrogenase [Dermatophilaceae bacterium]|nr:NAD(P)-dependent glycerol-3-phosphate dehydrogenase [Intrasporangiaceae bacterium]